MCLSFMFNYRKEKYNNLITLQGIKFYKKLENEVAYDGIIKIYSFKSSDDKINTLLNKVYFGDFIYQTSNGILLRLFKSRISWSKTSLVHLNIEKKQLKVIKEIKSSYDIWTVNRLTNNAYVIEVAPNEVVDFVDL
jgi:hypothetical protein